MQNDIQRRLRLIGRLESAATIIYAALLPSGLYVFVLQYEPQTYSVFTVVLFATFIALAVFFSTFLAHRLATITSTMPVVFVFITQVAAVLLAFMGLYLYLQAHNSHAFTETMTKLDAFYLSVTTFTTVGSGVLAPVSQEARATLTAESLIALLIVAVDISLLISARRRRS